MRGRPAGERELGVLGGIAAADPVVILGEHGAIAADEHRTERLVARRQGLRRELYAATQVDEFALFRHEVSGCAVPQ
ncbi:hypothetical protein GCM10018773_43200 [Streptomyces candidus]|nr:hypothetical protein GCM10018773_43200 [Streptomyces candidus]